MRFILAALAVILTNSPSWAQLPPCPESPNERWHECLGRYVTQSGQRYTGEFRNNKYHGVGSMRYPDGAVYEGEWRANFKHGQGRYFWPDGQRYVGEFMGGRHQGRGVHTTASGESYEGEFRDDLYHGQGKYTNRRGEVTYGEWSSGRLVRRHETPHEEPQPLEADVPDLKDNELYPAGSGTAFAVSSQGHIVTNHHVIRGCDATGILVEGEGVEARVLANDRENDLAVLRANFSPREVFSLSQKEPALMQEVFVAGFPFGRSLSSSLKVTKGIVSSLAGLGNNHSQIQIDAALQPGNSGGPIFDSKGNVVGVAVGMLDKKKMSDNFGVIPENINFGIKSSVLLSFLSAHQVATRGLRQKPLSPELLSRKATEATYFLSCLMTGEKIKRLDLP